MIYRFIRLRHEITEICSINRKYRSNWTVTLNLTIRDRFLPCSIFDRCPWIKFKVLSSATVSLEHVSYTSRPSLTLPSNEEFLLTWSTAYSIASRRWMPSLSWTLPHAACAPLSCTGTSPPRTMSPLIAIECWVGSLGLAASSSSIQEVVMVASYFMLKQQGWTSVRVLP